MPYNWFPLGLALGDAFCNRQAERQQLKNNFDATRHSLLISPRRYGKTSLVMEAIRENNCTAIKIDFFTVTSIETAQKKILDAIGTLIPSIIGKAELALLTAKEYLKRFHLTVEYKEMGFSIGLKPTESDASITIASALKGLDKIAQKANRKIILFFDEVQALGLLQDNIIIEGAIREAAQESKFISYVFSGSQRRLLEQLFDDRSRPLYLLSQRIVIHRINEDEYHDHLNKASNDILKKELSDSSIAKILTVTERHPYYINALCSRLWTMQTPPEETDVISIWSSYVEEEKSRISMEFNQLPINQRKLLVAFANNVDIKEPTSHVFLAQVGLSSSSVIQSLTTLIQKDFLEKDEEGKYRFIDPMMKCILQD